MIKILCKFSGILSEKDQPGSSIFEIPKFVKMEQDQILDYQSVVDEKYVEINLASGGKRFGNYIVDTIAVIIIYFAIIFLYGMFLGAPGGVFDESSSGLLLYVIIYGTQFMYFAVMEASFQKTLGKMITKTKVVTEDGHKPSNANILGRSLCRFIPFDAFSFLGSRAVGWHDTISKTNVINDVPSDLSGKDHKVVDQGF